MVLCSTCSRRREVSLERRRLYSLSFRADAGTLAEEQQLALALKASIDTALEEQTIGMASILFNSAPGNFLIL